MGPSSQEVSPCDRAVRPERVETRRQRVVALLDQELSLHEIARRLGCHASSVLRWRNAWQAGGPDALKAKPAAGRPARSTANQKARLVRFLVQGAMAHGYRTELWTTQRIAALIERRLGVPLSSQPRGQAPAPARVEPPRPQSGGPWRTR